MITTKLETITPEKAVEWLDLRNSKQRAYRKGHAALLAEQIKKGNWRVNGESIKFSETDHLLDGQHRLQAIYLAKKPIETMVTRGLPDEVFDSLDMGKKRTVADVLSMNGEANYSELAAAIALAQALGPVIRYEKPPMHLVHFHQTAIDAEKFLRAYPKIRKSAELARQHYTKLIRPSTMAGLHWIFGQSEIAGLFVRGMSEGFMPTDSSQQPLHLFREAMIANKLATRRLRRHQICALAIKAVNAALRGEKIKELSYERDERFPVPLTK